MAIGTITRDPDAPDGEKPFLVPLQAVAPALVQVSVVDSGYHSEVGDAERVTVGTTCPEADSGKATKPSLNAATNNFRDIRRYRNLIYNCGDLKMAQPSL